MYLGTESGECSSIVKVNGSRLTATTTATTATALLATTLTSSAGTTATTLTTLTTAETTALGVLFNETLLDLNVDLLLLGLVLLLEGKSL
jgi:hypothetical protein